MKNFKIKFFHTIHVKNLKIKSSYKISELNLVSYKNQLTWDWNLFHLINQFWKILPWYLLAIILQAANQQVCIGVECGRFTADIYICILILIYLLIYICILILIYYLLIWLCTMHWHFCSRVTALDRDFNQVHELWLLRSIAKNTNFVQVTIKSVLKTCLSYNHGS